MYSLTGAHRRIPLHTYAKVTNLKNNKSIVVKINDRPAKSNKRLDLSYTAARELGITGVAPVRIDY